MYTLKFALAVSLGASEVQRFAERFGIKTNQFGFVSIMTDTIARATITRREMAIMQVLLTTGTNKALLQTQSAR